MPRSTPPFPPRRPPLFCVDIGNTHTHFGLLSETGTVSQGFVATPALDHPIEGLAQPFAALQMTQGPIAGIAFCSVVPAANALLRRVFEKAGVPLFQLTHAAGLGLPIDYPAPAEIGQDRLANAAGAHALHPGSTIVIDLGTAVTFDVISADRGYEGGIIAPGIDLMRSYLHERTAQLPLIGDAPELAGVIGRSTVEAMHIGTVLGFAGMIQALLDAVLAEFARRGLDTPRVLTTGGSARVVAGRIRPNPVDVPDLTLRGLAAAWRLNHAETAS